MTWNFRAMSRGEMNADPVEGEFFTPEGMSDALVRETVQNSLDAKAGPGPVRVRFRLCGSASAVPPARAQCYLDGLWPHLDGLDQPRSDVPDHSEPMNFLSIEDFGTRGLCGSPDQDADSQYRPNSGSHNDFYYFWRNIGRSRKQEAERGRWGLGKTVFPAGSRINSFFGLTVRADDHRELLMGQSVLKIHRIAHERYCPYGFFARLIGGDFQLPFENADLVAQFRADFALQRGCEPGLSIVVPYPDSDLSLDGMVRSAILHYFYPIIRGDLVVDVSGDGSDFKIDATSISSVVESVSWADFPISPSALERLFAIVRQTSVIPADRFTRLAEPSPARAPDWNHPQRFDAQSLRELREGLDAGQILAIRVPITTKPGGGAVQSSFFDVFLQHDNELAKGEDHYIRQGITISSVHMLKEKGFRALVVVHDKALSTLLGDAENPAHTDWVEKATRLKEKYEWGTYTVRFVRNAPSRILAQLLTRPEGRDEELLKSIFYLDEASADGRHLVARRGVRTAKGGKKPTPPPPIDRRVSLFGVQKIVGGFRVFGNPESTVHPVRISVKIAYELRRGNPFKKYDPLDFKLDEAPITVTAVGAEYDADQNVLEIEPNTSEFLVEVTGFDPHRDLRVKATMEENRAQEV